MPKARPLALDADLTPKRAKDMRKRSRKKTAPASRDRRLTGEPLDLELEDWLVMIAVDSTLWERAEAFERRERRHALKAGRKRAHTVAESFIVQQANALIGVSERQLIIKLNKKWRRKRINKALQKAWPNHPNRRLPPKKSNGKKNREKNAKKNQKYAMSRSQHRYFMDNHILANDEEYERLCHDNMTRAVEIAIHMGMLKPRNGSLNNPEASRYVFADLTFLRERYDHRNVKDKNSSRIDRTTTRYNGTNKDYAGSRGRNLGLVGVRNDEYRERVPLVIGVKPNDMTEGEYFISHLAHLIENYPDVKRGLLGTIYDMAIKGVHIDQIYDLGLAHIGKVPDTNQGEVASLTLRDEEFSCLDQETRTSDVLLEDGAPYLLFIDGDGEICYQPLLQIDLYRRWNKGEGRYRWYGDYAVPDKPWMGALAGAVTTLRLDSTREERDGQAKRRTNYLRAIPETDPRFKRLFGPRETAESFFRSLKMLTPDQRALSVTARRVQLNLLAFQTQESMKALISHHERTGADVSRWFGSYSPLPRAGPIPRAGPLALAA